MSESQLLSAAVQQAVDASGSEEWTHTLRRVARSIVNVRMEVACGLEGDGAYVSQGTGFVVDAERELILTNRHIATVGWTRHSVVFVATNEEAPATVVYRDPIHDFAILRVASAALRHTQLETIELSPEGATVGTEIRVVRTARRARAAGARS